MSKKPINVKFLSPEEIRMGSPYSCCGIKLAGKWIPDIPNDREYQNIKAWSPDGNYLALVRWNTKNNEPGFNVIIISVKSKTYIKKRRRKGCCEDLVWEKDGFVYYSFRYEKKHIPL